MYREKKMDDRTVRNGHPKYLFSAKTLADCWTRQPMNAQRLSSSRRQYARIVELLLAFRPTWLFWKGGI
jgi:hypothetical protein